MPKLVLRPTISEFNRAQLEEHIESKRMRRMRAAVIYHEGVAAKLQHESDEVAKKWARRLATLQKKLEVFDKAYDGILHALSQIGDAEGAYQALQDQIAELQAEEQEDAA